MDKVLFGTILIGFFMVLCMAGFGFAVLFSSPIAALACFIGALGFVGAAALDTH